MSEFGFIEVNSSQIIRSKYKNSGNVFWNFR